MQRGAYRKKGCKEDNVYILVDVKNLFNEKNIGQKEGI